MSQYSKKEIAAGQFLVKAQEAGHIASLEGNWVVFRPPLPAEMIISAAGLGDAMASFMRKAKL